MLTPSRGARRCHPLPGKDRLFHAPSGALGKSPQRALAFPIAAALALLLSPEPRALAGDILRGGRPAAPVGGTRSSAGTVADPVAGSAAANARDALARSSKAVDAVRAMQDAARAQARTAPVLNNLGKPLPPVPNGLVTGGLKVATGADARWQGASLPRMTVQGGQTVVSIKQSDSRALLNWETFNVGKNTALVFDQSAGGDRIGQWIAFNKIIDPSLNPSQILGSIRAGGQVYVINPNGIIFGGTSVVNVHTLTASTLPINENLIARGLLNQETRNPKFLFNSVLTDGTFVIPAAGTYTTAQPVADGAAPKLSFVNATAAGVLAANTDYTLSRDATGRDVVTFTPAGLGTVGTGSVSITYATRAGDVVVQPGAKLTSPSTAAKVGGRIALFGPNVYQGGTIATPDGQTILAAGRQIGLAAHPSTDPSLRGLDVFVGVADGGSGRARNTGLIDAPRASVTMAGKSVEQLGAIDSSTSVSLNGRVDLRASYGAVLNLAYDPVLLPDSGPFLLASTGTLTLGAASVIRIMPEVASLETTIGTTLALRSQVNFQGKVIHLAKDAFVLAPNALVNADAGRWNLVMGTVPVNTFVHAGGQIYLESGAAINVAGTADVPVPIGQNILTLQLRGAELADSPLQRTGPLRGASLSIDLRIGGTFNGLSWVGTPLGDASGFAGLIQRTAAELTVAGGSVSLRAGDSVVMQPGSILDVSGGYINFQGGLVHTTRIFSGGQLMDISKASPDLAFSGIYTGKFIQTSAKYGITETFGHPLTLTGDHFEAGYLQGADGGTITISAASMALDGTLLGQTIAGAHQRDNPAAQSAVNFSFTGEMVDPQTSALNLPVAPTPPTVVFGDGLALAPADPFSLDANGNPAPLRTDRTAQASISPSLFTTGGFGKVSVDNGDGDILVPTGSEIVTPAGGGLTLRAANLEIQRAIRSPGGALSFTAYNYTPYPRVDTVSQDLPIPKADRGRFILGPVTLSTAGLIVDDRNGFITNSPIVTAGGSISIQAFSANLQAGSVLDVSGGVAVTAKGATTFGAGGSIVVAAGRDPLSNFVIGGTLSLDSELRGYSGGKGGSLSITAPRIVVGGSAAQPGALAVAPAFFSTGGFTNFSLTGFGTVDPATGATLPGLEVLPGTTIHPVATSWLAVPNADGETAVTLAKTVLPVGLRTPVSLSLNAPGVSVPAGSLAIRGDLVFGAGASVATDPRAQVSITGQTVTMLGEIVAPGGGINLAAAGSLPVRQGITPQNASATLWLGPEARLSTAGVTLLTPDAFGRRMGSVLPGGTIRVAGNLVAEAGAVLDVSGGSGTLDIAPSALPGAPGLIALTSVVPGNSGLNAPLWKLATVPTVVASDAGAISLEGGQELFFNGTLRGNAGGPTALGGTLAVSISKLFYAPTVSDLDKSTVDPNLTVTQTGGPRPAAGINPIGQAVKGANGQAFAPKGYFAVDRFSQGGFDSLSLGGNVRFAGAVTIDAARELSVGSGGAIYADAEVRLSAPHVTLGRPFVAPLAPGQTNFFFQDGANNPISVAPTFGRGRLTVTAQLIDVGDLSLQNIGHTALIAAGGDIRGDGTLDAAGDLILRAGQVYPVTAATFTIAAYDKTVFVASSAIGIPTVTLASAALPPGFGIGSSLLGSTVQSISGTTVTLTAGANESIGSLTAAVFAPGTITVLGSGSRDLPLSAAGTLNLYGSVIQQGGVLRAPLGTINIGW
ncbi:MAG TPA: filamentous hemagglutinin N-terminal domain-containing protein, partial [Chthoniobacteraceae bacterium]|nr:filamentous hemagglutinin N-terminal domain-containing protein [Chthoniobacteraceae bacterium]